MNWLGLFVHAKGALPTEELVHAVAVTSRNHLLACSTSRGAIYLADLQTLRPFEQPLTWNGEDAEHIVFSPDGKTLVAAYKQDIVQWNVDPAFWF